MGPHLDWEKQLEIRIAAEGTTENIVMSDKVADTPSQSRTRWMHHVGKFEEKFRSGFCSTAGDSDKG
jgi:hypothetical protein